MAFQIVTVQRNYFWEREFGYTPERPRICGTIIQKVASTKTHNECPVSKKTLKKKAKIAMSMVKDKYELAAEINKFSETQVRVKVRYIKYQNRNVTGKNIFIYYFVKTGTN